jgi:hypothetical protein
MSACRFTAISTALDYSNKLASQLKDRRVGGVVMAEECKCKHLAVENLRKPLKIGEVT